MKISVVIPTRNRAQYLAHTIESVLSQSYAHFEVIVSDNASTDETQDVVQQYKNDPRFRYHRNAQDIGLVANHKKALGFVRGTYFLILSDDDYLIDREYFSKAVSLIKRNPDLAMIYAQGYILYEGAAKKEALLLPFNEVESGKTIFLSRGTIKPLDFTLCNVLFHSDYARALNPFDNDRNMSSDSELFLKMCLRGRVGVIKDFVSVYRVHPSNVTHAIRRDPILLVNNLDYLEKPYQYAAKHDLLSQRELQSWGNRLVVPEIKMTILEGYLFFNGGKADEIISIVRARYPYFYNKVMSETFFTIGSKIARFSPSLYYLISGSYRRELSRRRKRMKVLVAKAVADRPHALPLRQDAGKALFFPRIRKTWKNLRRVDDIIKMNAALATELDALRSKLDLNETIVDQFNQIRLSKVYQAVYYKAAPRISICIGTYNRSRLLVERCLRSILNQTYENLEIIVVGDCCTDDTAEQMAKIRDPRVRFINLPERGNYPLEPELRWMVAGTSSINHAMSLASGDFITHLDDDDEYTHDRIQKIVGHIKATQADIVYHPFWSQVDDRTWGLNKAEGFSKGYVTTSSVLYHHWFKCLPWDMNAYKYREPGDWNRFRKFHYIGVRSSRYPEPLLRHYREKNQPVT